MRLVRLPLVCLLICSFFVSAFSFPTGAPKIKKVKIRGYITKINSPTSFEIDDYRVTRDESVVLDFENVDNGDVKFKPEDIRVGTEIEVRGMFNDETDELTATKVSIDLDQFRVLRNTTIPAATPSGIEKVEKGWRDHRHSFVDDHLARERRAVGGRHSA